MTAERSRAPLLRAAPAAGYQDFLDAPMDLLAPVAPHPDFAIRAAIWRDHAAGLISLAEAQRRSAAVGGTGGKVLHRRSANYPRHDRQAPNQSRQYAQPMATEAARDDRLTPNAKAFLQVLRARCGKGRETTITKGTMGAVMSRSARTIRRYLVDLVRFGYVELETRRNARGLHLGLTVRITEKVLPFFEEAKGLARWLAETPKSAFVPFSGSVLSGKAGVTLLTPKNQSRNNHPHEGPKMDRREVWRMDLRRTAAPA